MPTVIAYILQLTQILPTLIATGKDVVAFFREHSAKVDQMVEENRKPTAEEWAELNAKIDELRAELHS